MFSPLSKNSLEHGLQITVCESLLPAILQKLVGEFFWFFAGKFGKFSGKFGGNFPGFFLTHRTKAQKFRGKFRSIFRKKIRSSKNIFRAKFTLQTCHLKSLRLKKISDKHFYGNRRWIWWSSKKGPSQNQQQPSTVACTELCWELIFMKGMSTAAFQFSESGGSLHGRNLFTELPLL